MDLHTLSVLEPWDWPPEAAELLLTTLRNGAAPDADRELAAELASETVVINDALAAALLEIVGSSSESEELRGRAAIALGPVLEQMDMELDDFHDFDEPPISAPMFASIKDALRRLFLDAANPQEVRRRILEASVRSPEEWHSGAIRAAYHSAAPQWKVTAIFAMGYVPGFDEEIVEAIQDPDGSIRFEAVRTAGNQGVAAAYPHVRDIISGERDDDRLLLAAIEAIVYIRPEKAPDLLSDLLHSENAEVAELARAAIEEAKAAAGDDTGFEDF